MSRHELTLKEGIAAGSAFIGYDRPLRTFWVQILSAPDENGDETELLWAGTSLDELPRPIDAIRLAEPYCEIDAGLAARLEIDRMETLATTDGPNQVEAKAFLARLSSRTPASKDD